MPLPQQLFTTLDQQREDDEGTACGKCGHQDVLRLSHDLPVGERQQAGDQGGQDPKGQHQSQSRIDEQVEL